MSKDTVHMEKVAKYVCIILLIYSILFYSECAVSPVLAFSNDVGKRMLILCRSQFISIKISIHALVSISEVPLADPRTVSHSHSGCWYAMLWFSEWCYTSELQHIH